MFHRERLSHRERSRCLQELGLKESASTEDIKKAYKMAAIKYHPDKNPDKDTTEEFQKINAAYKYLTEGDAYLQAMTDHASAAESEILRFLFPWLFEQNIFGFANPFYGYYDNLSDDDDDDDIIWGPGEHIFTSHRGRGRYNTSSGRGSYADSTSGASQHYHRSTNFTHASTQHGQFFQETKTKQKTAKKLKKDAKRAAKLAADKERAEASKTSDATSQSRSEKVKSPTPDLPKQQQTSKEGSPLLDKGKDKSPSPENSNTDVRKNNSDEQVNKKSKKQIQMEQKQREKELKEINEELQRQEKERREKMEKRRAAQEERERQEREASDKDRLAEEEEERIRAEELRQHLERKEEEKKRKKREAAKMKKLLDEFDNCTFLDENGDFKYTDPEMKNIIHCDDIDQLGNAKVQQEKLETINGLSPESLIKLQEDKEAKSKSQTHQEKALGSPHHEKLGPIGSRPQNAFNNERKDTDQRYQKCYPQYQRQHQPQQPAYYQQQPHFYQQQPHFHQQHPNFYQQQHSQQRPQQQYNQPPRQQQHQPRFRPPFWSATQSPPRFNTFNTNIPRPSSKMGQGQFYKAFPGNELPTGTFTSQGYKVQS